MTKTTKIIIPAVVLFLLLVVAIFVVKHNSNDIVEDSCQIDSSEKGQCVLSNKCGNKTLTGANAKPNCEDDKICCPLNFILHDGITMKPVSTNFSETPLDNSPIPIEYVGLRSTDGEISNFKNHEKCGSAMGDRITNGEKASPGEFPFFVALKYKSNDQGYDFKCAGSLISGSDICFLVLFQFFHLCSHL